MFDASHQGRELFELGVRLGRLGTVAIGSAGGPLAKALARAAGCGAALAGAEVRFHDGSCAACGVWLIEYYDLPTALFIRQKGGEARVYVHDRDGRSVPVDDLPVEGTIGPVGEWDLLVGTDCAWAARRVGDTTQRREVACVQGPPALTTALERLGYQVSGRPVSGAPLFRADEEGFDLTIEWGGRVYHPTGTDALEAVTNFLEEPKAIPAFGPGDPPVEG